MTELPPARNVHSSEWGLGLVSNACFPGTGISILGGIGAPEPGEQ